MVNFPFGPAKVEALAYAATIQIPMDNTKVIGKVTLTGNATIDLNIDSEVPAGSSLVLIVTASGANRTLTPGVGMVGVAKTIASGTSARMEFVYDGTSYHQTSEHPAPTV